MLIKNKNKWLNPPSYAEGWRLTAVKAEGAFLRVEYRQISMCEIAIWTIFLNDQGREVARTLDFEDIPEPEVSEPAQPLTRWRRFCITLSLLWINIQEALPCHKR